jgi:hypothetical protein
MSRAHGSLLAHSRVIAGVWAWTCIIAGIVQIVRRRPSFFWWGGLLGDVLCLLGIAVAMFSKQGGW